MSEPLEEVDDWTLLRRWAAGDESAFDDLHGRHATQLFKFLKSQMKNRHDAEETSNEAWSRVAKSSPPHEGNFRAWLFEIARNLMFDRFRKQRRQPGGGGEKELTQIAAKPDRSVELESLTKDLSDCIDKLEKDYRDVVKRILGGDGHKAIAEALNISESASQKRLFRAKPLLQECLKAKGRDL